MARASKILIVEDDYAIRETIAELLEGEGYAVERAANGAEALEQLREHGGASLILLDLMMPVMDGWEFRSRLEQDPELAKIPIVVLSADNALESKIGGLHVAGYLTKPFEIDNLLETIDRFRWRGSYEASPASPAG